MGNLNSHASSEVVLEERSEVSFSKLLEAPSLAADPLYASIVRKQLPALQAQLSGRGTAAKKEASQGFGVLHLCCVLKWQEGLNAALQAGAPVDQPSSSGYTPLHLATYCSWPEGCRILLEHGARAEARSRRGSTARHFAAQQENRAVLELLIAGADPSSVNSPGFRSRTPLHLAVLSHGDPAIVKLLIDAGANTSAPNRALHGITPLHTAAHHGRVAAMRALLEANANPNVVSDDGVSPLLEVFAHPGMRHSEEKLRAMFALLRDAGANVNCLLPRQGYSLLHFALTVCEEESTVELLLNSGVNPCININRSLSLFDPRSKSTMMHRAARRGWAGVVQRLIAAGADLTLRDRDGMQPIHVAVINKRPDIIRMLLRAGADPLARAANCYPSFSNWKMNRGMQAIQAMMEMQPDGMDALAQLLEDPEEEMSAVDMACCVSPQFIPSVEAFLEFGAVPSREALELAVKDSRIMRAIVERPFWAPERHQLWPESFKASVRQLLMCLHRATGAAGVELPQHLVAEIINKMAYPVSQWADPAWLAAQRAQQPEHPLPPFPGQPAGGAAVAGAQPGMMIGAAAAPGGGHGLAGLMGQVFQQLQQGIQDVLGQVQAGQGDDEEGGQEGGAAAGPAQQPAAAAGVEADPLLGNLLPPQLLPHVVHQQALGPNMHIVQLEFNMPFAQLMEGLPGGMFPPQLGGGLGVGGGVLPGALPAPFGLPGFVLHAGAVPGPGALPGLFPHFMGLVDDGEEEEFDEEEEMEDTDIEEEQFGAAAPPHAQPPQQQQGAGVARGRSTHAAGEAGPSASRQAPSSGSVPLLEEDKEGGSCDEGGSVRVGSKRSASGGDGRKYNLRSCTKRHKSS